MKLLGIWSNNIANEIEQHEDKSEAIEMLLSLIDVSRKYDTHYHVDQDRFYSCKIDNVDFSDWLYDYSVPEIRDLKRELSIYISRAMSIASVKYAEVEKRIYAGEVSDEKYFFISYDYEYVLCSCDRDTYYRMKRFYLANAPSRNVFSEDLWECCENLYFHSGVASSLNTLNNEFNSIKGEIVQHLSFLNAYHASFCNHREASSSNKEVCIGFKEFSKIDCSPQSGRDTTKTLKRSFLNTKTSNDEVILCELHTKFHTRNRNREKQDRIYFHPGKDDVENGRVLIIHIGEHQ